MFGTRVLTVFEYQLDGTITELRSFPVTNMPVLGKFPNIFDCYWTYYNWFVVIGLCYIWKTLGQDFGIVQQSLVWLKLAGYCPYNVLNATLVFIFVPNHKTRILALNMAHAEKNHGKRILKFPICERMVTVCGKHYEIGLHRMILMNSKICNKSFAQNFQFCNQVPKL